MPMASPLEYSAFLARHTREQVVASHHAQHQHKLSDCEVILYIKAEHTLTEMVFLIL
jgi:hypothetical protein